MAEARVERRLSAILAADVAGYSRLMGADEEGTLAGAQSVPARVHRSQHRATSRPDRQNDRRWTACSNLPAPSMRCAARIEVQRAMAERNAGCPARQRIEFRIGINVGDIIIDEAMTYSATASISRHGLETWPNPAAICVSDDATSQVRESSSSTLRRWASSSSRTSRGRCASIGSPRWCRQTPARRSSLPDKPSIAVLPFQNMSGDPEQEYFADGMVEDIITALSRIRWLFVIARNSSFTYKGRAVDVKQVGRELGVRYVLEGSVRKAANRVRITGQLIDASTGAHLWADRFDGALEDIFDLQDQVTASVVGAIAPQLEQAEIERAKRKPTESLDAYDYFLRGMASYYRRTREAINEALPLFYKAIELDPDFASAYGMAAWCYAWRKINGWMTDRVQEIAETARLARRAAELGRMTQSRSLGALMRSDMLSATWTPPPPSLIALSCSIRT